jgi:PAS domain S-box-containing protein
MIPKPLETNSYAALVVEVGAILDAVVEGVCGVDAAGNATFCNDALAQMTGYRAEEIVGQNVHELLHHSHPDGTRYPAEECAFRKAVVAHEAANIVGEVLWRKDGTRFPTDYWRRPLKQLLGRTCYVVTIKDISEIQNARDVLRRREEKFRRILTEVLSLVNPAAFSRAERARRYIHHVVTAMNLGNPWQYEVAAMLSQLGCVTLAPETIDAVYRGEPLSPNEEAQYDAHPSVAYALLSKIPRLEPIAWMIQHQNHPVEKGDGAEMGEMRLGAEILRLILGYEKSIHQGTSRTEAAHMLARQNRNFSAEFFQALVTLDPNSEESELRKCRIEDLSPGMIIQQEVCSYQGTLLVSVIFKLKNFHARRDRRRRDGLGARDLTGFCKGSAVAAWTAGGGCPHIT